MTEEEAFIRAFVVPEKRVRFATFVASPKRRRDFTRTLAHFLDRDRRWMTVIPPDQQTCRAISSLLRANGAGDTCFVISENSDFDGRSLPLDEALELVVDTNSGSILSCVPGRLAYYEGEEPTDRCIFARACPL